MKKYLKSFLALAMTGALLGGCEEETFEQSAVAFLPTATNSLQEGSALGTTFDMVFSRALDDNGSVVISITSETAVAGVNYDVDVPSFKAGEYRINVPAGETTASFKVTSIDDDAFTNGHNLTITITEVSGGVRSIAQSTTTLRITDNDPPSLRAFFDFENCGDRYSVPPGFTEERVPGFKADRGWGCQPFGFEGQGVQASAFGGESGTSNTYLILHVSDLPSVDLGSYSATYVGFIAESYFDGAGTIKLLYSLDYPGSGNPEDFAWTEVPIADQLPPTGSGQANAPDGFWKEIFVDASGMAGQSGDVYMAIQYVGASNSSSASWTIDNVAVYGD